MFYLKFWKDKFIMRYLVLFVPFLPTGSMISYQENPLSLNYLKLFIGIKLEHADVKKDLGVSFSHNLSWNNHVDLISSKAQRMLNVLYRTCSDINDFSTTKLLYIAWVRSRLEYASVVWSPHTKPNINNLEQVQRRATRFILGRDYTEYERALVS